MCTYVKYTKRYGIRSGLFIWNVKIMGEVHVINKNLKIRTKKKLKKNKQKLSLLIMLLRWRDSILCRYRMSVHQEFYIHIYNVVLIYDDFVSLSFTCLWILKIQKVWWHILTGYRPIFIRHSLWCICWNFLHIFLFSFTVTFIHVLYIFYLYFFIITLFFGPLIKNNHW